MRRLLDMSDANASEKDACDLLSRETREAFAANNVEAVLHYSQRSARAFLDAARSAGVEISALAVPHSQPSITSSAG